MRSPSVWLFLLTKMEKKVSNAEVKGFANEFRAKPTEGEDKEGSCQRKTCDYVIHPGTQCQK